ncbi:MAG: tetratricopeptide repeat protein, partial [Calditrichaeota bacterium]
MGIKKRWIAFFLVGILGITVLLYASDTRLIDLHVKSGEYEEAIRLYENVLFTQPQNARLHYELANVFLLADRSNEALEYLHKAYALGDNSDRLLRQLYSAYQKNENRNGMITMLETLVKRHPKDRNQRAQLAALYAWADQPDAAITHYRYLLEHEPDNAEFVYKLSSLYQADQSYAKAAVVLENYRTYAPSDEKASHLLADVYLADGRWKKAAAYYEQFVRDNPADIALRDRLVEIYKWKKKAPRALPHLHYLADAEFASRATYRNQFLALSRQYEPLHAVHYLENRLKMEPENTNVHLELA